MNLLKKFSFIFLLAFLMVGVASQAFAAPVVKLKLINRRTENNNTIYKADLQAEILSANPWLVSSETIAINCNPDALTVPSLDLAKPADFPSTFSMSQGSYGLPNCLGLQIINSAMAPYSKGSTFILVTLTWNIVNATAYDQFTFDIDNNTVFNDMDLLDYCSDGPTCYDFENLSQPITSCSAVVPTQLATNTITPTTATASWSARYGWTYDYQQALATNAFSEAFNNTDQSTTTFLGLSPNTNYKWRVREVDPVASCKSAWSDAVYYTTICESVPTPIGMDKIIDAANASVQLVWTPIDGIANYEVQFNTIDNFTGIPVETVAAPPVTKTNLTRLMPYYWRVRIVGANNCFGEWCATQNFVVPSLPCPNPGAPVLTTNPGTCAPIAITFEWTPGTNLTDYETVLDQNAPVYTTDLTMAYNFEFHTSHVFKVRSRHLCADQTYTYSDWQTVNFTTMWYTPTALQPNGTINEPTTKTLTWAAVVGAPRYQVQVRIEGLMGWVDHFTTTNSIELTGLSHNVTYLWKVKVAELQGCEGNFSNEASFSTKLVTPTNLAPAGGITVVNPVTLTWNAVEGATGYTVKLASDPNFESEVEFTTTDPSSPRGNLPANVHFYFKVKAINATNGRMSDYSTVADFVTPLAPHRNHRCSFYQLMPQLINQ